jgi:hypothetical protein
MGACLGKTHRLRHRESRGKGFPAPGGGGGCGPASAPPARWPAGPRGAIVGAVEQGELDPAAVAADPVGGREGEGAVACSL